MNENLPPPAAVQASIDDARVRKRSFRFRPAAKMDPNAAVRQGQAVSLALAQFGDIGAAISFLNTHHTGLDARPIDLALASAAGLARVEQAIAPTPDDPSGDRAEGPENTNKEAPPNRAQAKPSTKGHVKA